MPARGRRTASRTDWYVKALVASFACATALVGAADADPASGKSQSKKTLQQLQTQQCEEEAAASRLCEREAARIPACKELAKKVQECDAWKRECLASPIPAGQQPCEDRSKNLAVCSADKDLEKACNDWKAGCGARQARACPPLVGPGPADAWSACEEAALTALDLASKKCDACSEDKEPPAACKGLDDDAKTCEAWMKNCLSVPVPQGQGPCEDRAKLLSFCKPDPKVTDMCKKRQEACSDEHLRGCLAEAMKTKNEASRDCKDMAQVFTVAEMKDMEAKGEEPLNKVRVNINDQRARIQASFYTGLGIDTFAAGEVNKYLNQGDASDVKERLVAGFDFEVRVAGNESRRGQLWVYGETIHGLRSAEVDCTMDPNNSAKEVPAVCPSSNTPAGQQAFYIIRNATSLEGFMGLRYEFARLQGSTTSTAYPLNVYVKAQAGFLTVANNGGDIVDLHHLGLGLISSGGRFAGSYLEVGHGRSDIFLTNRTDRWKIDGFLTWSRRDATGRSRILPFAQINIDSDLGDGADSIQTYLGLDFDLDEWFAPGATATDMLKRFRKAQ